MQLGWSLYMDIACNPETALMSRTNMSKSIIIAGPAMVSTIWCRKSADMMVTRFGSCISKGLACDGLPLKVLSLLSRSLISRS